jgi:hypothetical protein
VIANSEILGLVFGEATCALRRGHSIAFHW